MSYKHTVLFVDDEVSILSSLRRGLVDEDYLCLFAHSGYEALKILEEEPVSVIVSDMRMPDMDGLALLKNVKAKYPKIVRIVLSGYSQLQQVIATINQVDIFKFIAKPWNLEEDLKVVINQAIDYYQLQVDNEEYKNKLEAQNKAYQRILRRVDEVISESKHNAEMYGNVGNIAFDRIMKSMGEENYRPEIAKRKIEVSMKILQALTQAGLGEVLEKDANEIVTYIENSLRGFSEVSKFDIENKIEKGMIVKTNVDVLQALIIGTLSILVNGVDNSLIKITAQKEVDEGVTYCAITILVSHQTKMDISFLKEEYDRSLDVVVEILNYIVGCAMGYLNGNYACSRIGTYIAQKFLI